MSNIIKIAPKFINIRGNLNIGPINAGIHTSLVQRKSGKWLMLDAVQLEPGAKAEVDQLTNKGQDIEAVLNLHPFHTSFCAWVHEAYPNAKLIGSARHQSKLPDLPWEAQTIDDPAVREQYKEDLDLRVPDGVAFIPENELVHFSSVLAYHPESKTLHVDDTFNWLPLPEFTKLFRFHEGTLQMHPTLPAALEGRSGAATALRTWTQQLISDWDVQNLCAAHSGTLLAEDNTGDPINKRMLQALKNVEPVLKAQELVRGQGGADM